MSDIQNFLRSLICELTSPDEGRSLNLNVTLTPTDELFKLRQQIDELQKQYQELQDQYKRTEYLYRCEVLANLQIIDLAAEEGINIPKRLKERTKSSDKMRSIETNSR